MLRAFGPALNPFAAFLLQPPRGAAPFECGTAGGLRFVCLRSSTPSSHSPSHPSSSLLSLTTHYPASTHRPASPPPTCCPSIYVLKSPYVARVCSRSTHPTSAPRLGSPHRSLSTHLTTNLANLDASSVVPPACTHSLLTSDHRIEGDATTLVIHPALTTDQRLSEEDWGPSRAAGSHPRAYIVTSIALTWHSMRRRYYYGL
ncbi:hypothetical protein C8R44DRAFT_981556 [Mycena epipterygia]|nr:hypothetical protein C8R44DRAFT_981556 [Mycena epipterygia]